MERFLHQSVRLHTDIDRAWRYFCQPDHMERWMAESVEADSDTPLLTLQGVGTEVPAWSWEVVFQKKRQHLICRCPDVLGNNPERLLELEVHLMMCTARTEYCTEVHLLFKCFGSGAAEEALRDRYSAFWSERLERLRHKTNGDWIIQDQDLTLSTLMSF